MVTEKQGFVSIGLADFARNAFEKLLHQKITETASISTIYFGDLRKMLNE